MEHARKAFLQLARAPPDELDEEEKASKISAWNANVEFRAGYPVRRVSGHLFSVSSHGSDLGMSDRAKITIEDL